MVHQWVRCPRGTIRKHGHLESKDWIRIGKSKGSILLERTYCIFKIVSKNFKLIKEAFDLQEYSQLFHTILPVVELTTNKLASEVELILYANSPASPVSGSSARTVVIEVNTGEFSNIETLMESVWNLGGVSGESNRNIVTFVMSVFC